MKSHVTESRAILEATEGVHPSSFLVAHQHHKRHDGAGYPLGHGGADRIVGHETPEKWGIRLETFHGGHA